MLSATYRAQFDVHPEGKGFVVVRPLGEETLGRIVVVLDWFEELKAAMAAAAATGGTRP